MTLAVLIHETRGSIEQNRVVPRVTLRKILLREYATEPSIRKPPPPAITAIIGSDRRSRLQSDRLIPLIAISSVLRLRSAPLSNTLSIVVS